MPRIAGSCVAGTGLATALRFQFTGQRIGMAIRSVNGQLDIQCECGPFISPGCLAKIRRKVRAHNRSTWLIRVSVLL
jgi:hypothetical protein